MKRDSHESLRPRERGSRGAVTILQIAQSLNLSHSTVSRVLNNKPHTYISEDTRKKVLAVAREMGYRPNLAARSLRDARCNMIGIFASPDIGVWSGMAASISRSLSEALHERQMHLFFALVAADEDERSLPAWQFDGAILLQQPSQASIRHLLTVDRPFVAINERVDYGISVLADEADGMTQGMEHLWELGHRRIAYANATQWHFPHYSVDERQEAYIHYMADRDGEPIVSRAFALSEPEGIAPVESGVAWLRQTVQEGTTAIVAYDHLVAVDILAAAQRLSLRVPQDFSLICFNDDVITRRLFPPLTVVAPQGEAMGHVAADILLRRMDALEGARLPEDADVEPIIRVPERLIPRASTGPPRQ